MRTKSSGIGPFVLVIPIVDLIAFVFEGKSNSVVKYKNSYTRLLDALDVSTFFSIVSEIFLMSDERLRISTSHLI